MKEVIKKMIIKNIFPALLLIKKKLRWKLDNKKGIKENRLKKKEKTHSSTKNKI